jgi:hypothetical protein
MTGCHIAAFAYKPKLIGRGQFRIDQYSSEGLSFLKDGRECSSLIQRCLSGSPPTTSDTWEESPLAIFLEQHLPRHLPDQPERHHTYIGDRAKRAVAFSKRFSTLLHLVRLLANEGAREEGDL